MSGLLLKIFRIFSSDQISGTGPGPGTSITVVTNYSALPTAASVPLAFYWCSNSQGTAWLPGSLGGTYYSAGLYYSNGATWEYMDVPYQATQVEVDAGTNTDHFVTPKTLKDAAQWNQKADTNSVVNSINASTGAFSLNVGSSLSLSSAANNITFGLASNITTALQSAGAYLTTAALSNHSHNFATTTTNGSLIIVATTNSNGATIAVPSYLTTAQAPGAYLTTAAQSNQVVNSINGSTGTFSFNTGSSLSSSRVGNAITWGLASNITTALQSAGAYLTTARASNDAIGLNTAQSNVTWTVNSSGISINANGYAGTGTSATNASITLNSNGLAISVAAPGGGGAVNFSAGTTSANLQSVTFGDANGISFGLNAGTITGSHNGLTTAALSNHSHNLATTTTNGSLIVIATTNSAGATFAVPPYLTTAQAPGAYLTTARASNDAIGLNTAITQNGVSMTANSSGLSLNFPAFLTTAAQSNHSHGNPTLALTNINGTTASASNGLTLSLSAVVPAQTVQPVAASGSNGSFNFSTLSFGNLNGLSFYTSNGSIVGSYTDAGAGGGISAINISAGTTSNNLSAFTFSNGSGVSFGLNGSVITASVNAGGGGITEEMWWPYNEAENVAGQRGNASWAIGPVPLRDNLSIDRLCIPQQLTNATNSTGSVTVSYSFGLYTRNISSLSLAFSTTATIGLTFSGTINNSTYAGIRLVTTPWSTSFPPDRYYIAMASRTTSGGANSNLNHRLITAIASNFSGVYGTNSNRSNQWPLGLGVYSASSTGFPNPIPFSQIDGTASLVARPPSWFMINGTA